MDKEEKRFREAQFMVEHPELRDDSDYEMVARKRAWCPEWLFKIFSPVILIQPFRWIFTEKINFNLLKK